MHFTQTLSLGLAFVGLCTFGIVASKPVAAQNLTCTLSGVTFGDGATATGYFNFNPTTQTVGTFDVVTANGIPSSFPGNDYANGLANFFSGVAPLGPFQGEGEIDFDGIGSSAGDALTLFTSSPITSAGVYFVTPGTRIGHGSFSGSGESYNTQNPDSVRTISTGSIVVTNAVPEASTTISFGLLLALGLGGAAVAVRKKKALAQG